MRKLLLGLSVLGASMLGLASFAAPASAQGWGGYYGYDYGRGYGGYAENVRQHARACAKHERFHERLAEEHAQEHDDGFYSHDDHADAHDALDEAHDEYHDEHGGLNHCDYWNRQYYRMMEGRSYPRRYGWYGSGY